jgi:acetyl esterase/lipase
MRHWIRTSALAMLLAASGLAQDKTAKPAPEFADVTYGPHERNVFDLWRPKGDGPFPLVLYIHGGGFMAGDKKSLGAAALQGYLNANWAVAAINYRFTNVAPEPAQYLDCARALQTLRHRAKEWKLDPRLVASTGGSAGAGTSMWLAFHDDLADPKSDDPVARESTRLTCISVNDGQCSYDPRFAEKIGMPRPNFDRHRFFLAFYGIKADEIDTPKAYARYEEAAPITYLTKDDPPAMLSYSYPNEEVDAKSNIELVVHHPKLGLALKQRMDQLGIECRVFYKGMPEEQRISTVDFFRKHFENARQSK